MSKSLTTRARGALSTTGTSGAKKVTPPNAELVIADISGSMDWMTEFQVTRWDCLQKALAPLKGRCHVLAFSNYVIECDPDMLPRPFGGTSMHLALEKAASLTPMHVLLMSDGMPDLRDRTIEQAKLLAVHCIIDTLFIGDATDTAGKELMQEIAKIGMGRYQEFNMNKQDSLMLGTTIKNLLALPAPSGDIAL